MYHHSINAPDEMRELHKKFYEYMENVINITEAESIALEVKVNGGISNGILDNSCSLWFYLFR